DPGQPRPERASEYEHEQQQDDHWSEDGEHREPRVAHHVQQVSPQHRDRVGDDVGRASKSERGHEVVPFGSTRREASAPVRAKKTSSRSGVRMLRSSTSRPAASRRPSTVRRAVTPPSLGTESASAASSRVEPSNMLDAVSSAAASANLSRM